MQKIHSIYLIVILILLIPLKGNGQMFSVDDDYQQQTNPFAPYLRVGIVPTDLEFTGDASSLINYTPLSFSGTVAQLGFESGGFNLDLQLGNDFSGLNDKRLFSLALKFSNPFYFIRQPNFGLGVPLQLGTKLTSVRSESSNTEFAQTNLHAGAGAAAILFFPEKFSASFNVLPSFGFSTASGGLIGGNVFSWNGKVRLNFFNVIFGRNISLGYDFIYDSYDIDGDEYDYDLTGHSITLGISL